MSPGTEKIKKTKDGILANRPPVVVVMGHIDHGKSTLLDYIRRTNIVEKEKGGITQHLYAYEIEHGDKNKDKRKITFLDTPGHEAFALIRKRGAKVADIAIVVIAADDGIKPQTEETIEIIKQSDIPFVIALNKMDKPEANSEKVKQELAEREVFLEGYGGDIPVVEISAKTGSGVSDLLDMTLLLSDMAELEEISDDDARGIVIEAHRDSQKGITATVVIQSGVLRPGLYAVAGNAVASVRYIENFLGEKIGEAAVSSPVRIAGFDKVPEAGTQLQTFASKKEAEKHRENQAQEKKEVSRTIETKKSSAEPDGVPEVQEVSVPLVLKADSSGTLEALLHEIKKIKMENIHLEILEQGIGSISESNIKSFAANKNGIAIGFNVKVEPAARALAEQQNILLQTFDVIYEFTKWLEENLKKRKPVVETEVITGKAKIVRIFSTNKGKQVIGGRVEEGFLKAGFPVKIVRRGHEIGRGKILELQQQKIKAGEVKEGLEFGALVETRHEIAERDILEAITITEK